MTPRMSSEQLRTFTRVRGLVADHLYCECSPDVHELLAITADGLAERRWRLMGARSATEARPFFIARLRRPLSVVIAREMARRHATAFGVSLSSVCPGRPSATGRHSARTRGRSTFAAHGCQLAAIRMRYQEHAAMPAVAAHA